MTHRQFTLFEDGIIIKCMNEGKKNYSYISSELKAAGYDRSKDVVGGRVMRLRALGRLPKTSHYKRHAVICVETGVKYNTATEAARTAGLHSVSSLLKACNHPQKKAGGYHWQYV